jgi:tetratricopeptide (TPR) repeat protein
MRIFQTFLKTAICLVLIAAMAAARVLAQSEGEAMLEPPPGRGLVAVHLPDTSGMEAEVREHVAAAQGTLTAAIKGAGARPAAELAEAYGAAGGVYHAYALSAPAKECYLNASRLAPEDFRWVYLLGKLLQQEGSAEEALTHYSAARKLRPDYLPVFVSLGDVYLQLNRLDEAEASYTAALAGNEKNAAALYGLGQTALSRRNYETAARHFEKALALAPEANRLHYALAMAYRGLGQTEKARAQLALSGTVGVRAADPLVDGLRELVKGARLHLIRGRAALDARRFADAAEEFRKAIAAEPESVPAHFNLGATLSQLGDLRGAVEQFEKTLLLDPAHANAHYNLGLLLAQQNQHERAVEHLQAAVKASPSDTGARLLLAQSLARLGRLEEAQAELARVAEADPDNEQALLAGVEILLAKKQYAQALEALERGHARSPQKGLTTATLAYLLAASPRQDLRDGRRALELARAAWDATGLAQHGALVALALAELGRCDEAANWARQMIARAAEEKNPSLAEKLKSELNRYETARPCRPN